MTTEAPAPPKNETPPTPPANLPVDQGAEEEGSKTPLMYLLGNKQLGVKVSGRAPDSSILKIKGGKIELGGQFDRGDRLPTVFEIQVTGSSDDDAIDTESGTVKSTRRTQRATVCATSTLAEYLSTKLADHPQLLGEVLDLLGIAPE